MVSLSQNYTHQMLKDSPLLSILLQRPESFSHAIALDNKTASGIRQVLDTMVAEASQQKAFWTLRLSLLFTDLLIRLYRYSNSAFPVNAMDDAARIVTETQGTSPSTPMRTSRWISSPPGTSSASTTCPAYSAASRDTRSATT